ncbi:MAG: hypothetical protein KA100_04315 [Rickettsiales bacterium]|nr:hypothetical protein [Rickettsiales bacterium]
MSKAYFDRLLGTSPDTTTHQPSPAEIPVNNFRDDSPYLVIEANTPQSRVKAAATRNRAKVATPDFYEEAPEKFNTDAAWQRFTERFLASDEQKFEQFKSIEILKLAEFEKRVIETTDAVAADEYQELENSWKEIVGVILQKEPHQVKAGDSDEVVGYFPQLGPIFRSLQIAGWAQLRYKRDDKESALEVSDFLKRTKDSDEAILPKKTKLGEAHSDALRDLITKFKEASQSEVDSKHIPGQALRCLVTNALREEAMREVLKEVLGSLQTRIDKLPDLEKQATSKEVREQYPLDKKVSHKVFRKITYTGDISKTVDHFFTVKNLDKTQKWFKSIYSSAIDLNAELDERERLKKDLEEYSGEARQEWDSLTDKSKIQEKITEITNRQTPAARSFLSALFSSSQFSAADYFAQEVAFSRKLNAEIRAGLDEILDVVLGAIEEKEKPPQIEAGKSGASSASPKQDLSPVKQASTSAKKTPQSLQESVVSPTKSQEIDESTNADPSAALSTEKKPVPDTPQTPFNLSFTPDTGDRQTPNRKLFGDEATPSSEAATSSRVPPAASEWDDAYSSNQPAEDTLEDVAESWVRKAKESLSVLAESARAEIIALALGKSSAASLTRQISVKKGDEGYDREKHFTTDLIETFVPLSKGQVEVSLEKMRKGFKNKEGRIDKSGEPSDKRFCRSVFERANDISKLLVVVEQKLKEEGRDLSDEESVKSAISEISGSAQKMLKDHAKMVSAQAEEVGAKPSSSVIRRCDENHVGIKLLGVLKNTDEAAPKFARPIFTSSSSRGA